jgi:subtilisin family serine protease
MKKKRPSQSGFFNPRILLGIVLGSVGVLLVLLGFGMSSGASALAQDPKQNRARSDASQRAERGKIAAEVMAGTADGKVASVVILLADQADVSAAYRMQDHDARGWFVYNTLTQHAARTQADLQAFLAAQGVSYQSFWAANMIIATANRSLVETIAVRADVARINTNRPARWIEDPEVANSGVMPNSPNTPNGAEWGLLNVQAPQVWDMGFTGQGMVIGNLDTGTRWSHDSLKPKYRGWNGVSADHNFNWHDAIHSGGGDCGPDVAEPCDDSGHGTHTAGTTVGDDGGANKVGVAPGAKWIACRNMNEGVGTPATYTECFQFMIAPTDLAGNNANPALRPHVLNNSWGCPDFEGCTTRAELEMIVNNTQAAGIFVVVSAGNEGPDCETVMDAPAIYSASFSIGAINISNSLTSFSSRGPSTFYDPDLLKPNISAPGSNVRSAYYTGDSAYRTISGTSMAGPHVAGAVALLWSAHPQFVRDIAATKQILELTANPAVTVAAETCGGIPSTQIPNNSFGYGRLDALNAVNLGASPTPTPTPTATPTPTPPATPTPSPTPTSLANISTRLRVGTGDNALIGGFIVTGTQPKRVIVRATGPSLSLTGALTNPTLELRDGSGTLIRSNDDWRIGGQETEIIGTTIPPSNDLESAIVETLPANGAGYTAIVRGLNDGTGIGLVEVYDLDQAVNSRLANISTRGLVQTGDDVLIAGTIVLGPTSQRVIVRAIGPSLSLAGKLANPVLELRDGNGGLIRSNDDWRIGGQEAEIIGTGIPPADDLESAIVEILPANGATYTAIVRGLNGTTGIAVVEIYALN